MAPRQQAEGAIWSAAGTSESTAEPCGSEQAGAGGAAVRPTRARNEDDEWLAEGITEDLTIELSRFKALLVIARHTAETYAGRLGGRPHPSGTSWMWTTW